MAVSWNKDIDSALSQAKSQHRPVLVDFSSPRTGARHRLRFDCPGAGSSLALLSEEVESR